MPNTRNPQLIPYWKELFEKLQDAEYGSLITYQDLSDILGFDIKDKTYVIEQFKREMLRQKDKALENVRKKGYRVVLPNEHGRLTFREIRRAERRVRKGVEYALHVPFERLSDREKAQITLIANRAQNVCAAMIGESKSLKSVTMHFQLPSTPRPDGK